LNGAYPNCDWHVIDGCGLQFGQYIATQLSGDLCVPKDSDLFVISMQTASKGVGRIVTATPGTWPLGQVSRCFAAGIPYLPFHSAAASILGIRILRVAPF
jgi:hypothetical protein